MWRHSAWVVVALATGFEPAPDFAQTAQPTPTVAVTVHDPSGLVTSSLSRAESIAGDIYRNAGVRLVWELAASGIEAAEVAMAEGRNAQTATPVDRRLTVIVTTSDTRSAGLGTDAMGVAPSPNDGTRGTTAYVFSDRVTSFARAFRIVPAYVLAAALAHEIGHLLLPPSAHRPDGIMRDSWHPAFFPPRAPGVMGFPPDQARLLRLRAASS